MIPITNFCENNQCSKCGNCCTNFLYLTEKEIRRIHRYIEKKKIKDFFEDVRENSVVLYCPFRKDDGCSIYKERPEICRQFQCNLSPFIIEKNKQYFKNKEHYKPVDMRLEFYDFCIFKRHFDERIRRSIL